MNAKPLDRWRCFWCGQELEIERGLKPIDCPNPNCTHRSPQQHAKFIPLTGPYTYFEDGKFVPKKLADAIMSRWKFVTHRESGTIFVYVDGVYEPWGEEKIREEARRELDELAKENYVNETVEAIRESTYLPPEAFHSPDPHLVCVENGVVDLRTGALLPHDPKHIFLQKLPVRYDPQADCPNIRAHLELVCPDPRERKRLLQFFGYCLYRRYTYQYALMLVGPGGSGKSTTLLLLMHLLGRKNVASRSLQELSTDRFATADLFGKLANIFYDLPSTGIVDTSRFKALTGGDLVKAERKFERSFYFINYAKLIFSANQVPPAKDESDAYFRRWIIVNFPHQFGPEERDPYILQKLTTPQELSGFLNWIIREFREVLETGDFAYVKTVEETREDYLRRSDPIAYFAEACLVSDQNGAIPKRLMYQLFLAFCRARNLIPVPEAPFNRKLPNYATVRSERVRISREDGGVERPWCWVGVSANPEVVGAPLVVESQGYKVLAGFGAIAGESEESPIKGSKTEELPIKGKNGLDQGGSKPPAEEFRENRNSFVISPVNKGQTPQNLDQVDQSFLLNFSAGLSTPSLRVTEEGKMGRAWSKDENYPSKVTTITNIAKALQLLHPNGWTELELLAEVERAGIERQAGAAWLQKALEEGIIFEVETGIYLLVERPNPGLLKVVRLKEDLPDLVVDVKEDGQPVVAQARKGQLISLPANVAKRLIEKGKAEEVGR